MFRFSVKQRGYVFCNGRRGISIWPCLDDKILNCEDASEYGSVDNSPRYGGVDLLSIKLRPTNYALQYSSCGGMDAWNFEGSVDGVEWENLHAVRGEAEALVGPPKEVIETVHEDAENFQEGFTCTKFEVRVHNFSCPTLKLATQLADAYRKAWAPDPKPSKFYRYFRISGFGDVEYGGEAEPVRKRLHGGALWLYGDVWEE